MKDMTGFIWGHYNIRKGDYNELTRTIWKRAFGNENILEPVED